MCSRDKPQEKGEKPKYADFQLRKNQNVCIVVYQYPSTEYTCWIAHINQNQVLTVSGNLLVCGRRARKFTVVVVFAELLLIS